MKSLNYFRLYHNIIHSNSVNDQYSELLSSTLSSSLISTMPDASSSSISVFSKTNTNALPLRISSSTNLNSLNFSPSASSTVYTSDKTQFLLRNEKQRYDVISNNAQSAKASHWSKFGFPAKLNEKTGIFERIFGFTSCHDCRRTFVYNSNSDTSHLIHHLCGSNLAQISTTSSTKQPTVEHCLTIHKSLTTDRSTTIKDLIARWICTNIRPFCIIEDDGLKQLIQECIRLGMCVFSVSCSHIYV